MNLSKDFQSILWEYNLSKLSLDDNIVVQRILNLWDKRLTDKWIKKIWKEKAWKLFLKNQEHLDKKSANYWNIIFEIENNKNLKINRSMYEKLNTPIFTRSFG